MKLGVENLGTLSNVAFNIPRALHQFYFILPIRAWVGSFRIKKSIQDLMVIMPSYFYKDKKAKTWKSSVNKAIFLTWLTHKLRI